MTTTSSFSRSVWVSFWLSGMLIFIGLVQIGLHIYVKSYVHPHLYMSNCLLWSGLLTVAGSSGNFFMILSRSGQEGSAVATGLYAGICLSQIASLLVSEVFEWRLNSLQIVPESLSLDQLEIHCRYVYLLSLVLTVTAVVVSFIGTEWVGFVLLYGLNQTFRRKPSTTRSFLLGRMSSKTAHSWLYTRGRSSTPRSSVTRRDVVPKPSPAESFATAKDGGGVAMKPLGTIGSKVLLVAHSSKKHRPTVITAVDLQTSVPLKMIAAIRPSVFRRDSDLNNNSLKANPTHLDVVSLGRQPSENGTGSRQPADVYF